MSVPVALVVVHRVTGAGREYLVARRTPEGHWSLIAGLIEDGETVEEGARRELAEETGLAGPVAFEAVPMSLGFEGVEGWVKLHVFAAQAPRDWEPVLDEEHDDYAWRSEDEAAATLFFEEPRQALREVARRLEVAA
jgi:dATP pyrophosphohydrolase